jgi:hypothetical protein
MYYAHNSYVIAGGEDGYIYIKTSKNIIINETIDVYVIITKTYDIIASY